MSCKLHALLPATLIGIAKNPGVTGIPEAVKEMLPVPTCKVPAGAVIVIPFTVVLVNAG